MEIRLFTFLLLGEVRFWVYSLTKATILSLLGFDSRIKPLFSYGMGTKEESDYLAFLGTLIILKSIHGSIAIGDKPF